MEDHERSKLLLMNSEGIEMNSAKMKDGAGDPGEV